VKYASSELDAAQLAQVAVATSFVTSIFVGRGSYDKHESHDLVTARAVADQMTEHYRQNGRKAIVYAILPDGSEVLVPESYQPQQESKMKSYNKKFNAKRAAESLAVKFPAFTVVDPIEESKGVFFPALLIDRKALKALGGVPAEIAAAAFVNGGTNNDEPAGNDEPTTSSHTLSLTEAVGPDLAAKVREAKAKPAKAAKPAPVADGAEVMNGNKLPKAGTARRVIFDMLTRKAGATQKEVVDAGGIDESLSSYLVDWSTKYGLVGEKVKEGRSTRYFLKAA
jgi:hypothetical protein